MSRQLGGSQSFERAVVTSAGRVTQNTETDQADQADQRTQNSKLKTQNAERRTTQRLARPAKNGQGVQGEMPQLAEGAGLNSKNLAPRGAFVKACDLFKSSFRGADSESIADDGALFRS